MNKKRVKNVWLYITEYDDRLRYMDHDARKDPLESDAGKIEELFSIITDVYLTYTSMVL